jgi:2',3'-cyclic-nucleotide 2'-phosphodiesterase (5'-nucleotidase family)
LPRRGGWIACGIWLIAVLGAAAAGAATQRLVILHDNDIHGHLRDFCYVEVAKGPVEHCGTGGAARRASLVRALKARADAPVLLIDSGDTTTRGPLTTRYEGVDEIEAMNAIGYDMAAIGNNEFKLKDAADAKDSAGAQAAFQRLIKLSRFPWLCANVTDGEGRLLAGVHPFVVRRIGAVRVAFLGLTAPRSKSYPQTRGLVFVDPVAAAKTWIPQARAKADVVVAVTHIGVDEDRRLVRETAGLDAVVGGDSHTYLYQPVVERSLDGREVPIVQDGEFGVRLGEFRLTLEGNRAAGWRLARFSDDLIAVDSTVKPDAAVDALAWRYAGPLDVRVGSVPEVGATPAERARLTAEDLAQAWKQAAGAEVGLQPQAVLFDSFRTRDVTRYQVRSVLPFHDTLWRGQATGAQLEAMLAKPSALGGVMRATIQSADIDPARTYTIASTAFVGGAIGGGVDTGRDARDVAEAWLASSKSVH